jgi:hypothetical protein
MNFSMMRSHGRPKQEEKIRKKNIYENKINEDQY